MVRMFDVTSLRKQREVGGAWDMIPIDDFGKESGAFTVVVPSCWESVRGFENYRGRARYTKKLTVAGGNVRLVFKGVSHTADVFWDGKKIAHHYNAYTPFDAVIKNCKAGEHILEVIADNRYSPDSALHVPNDYHSYGGITRPVLIEEIGDAYIEYLHITPIKKDVWHARIKASVLLLDEDSRGYGASIELCGRKITTENLCFGNGIAIITAEVEMDGVEEWSPENPKLYTANITLFKNGTAIDDLNERIGFREVAVNGDRILLNGRTLFIKGFNRHEDLGNIGCAIPETMMNTDLDHITYLNANLVRTSHYPNDERFLDLCDERGILVWEEAHARQLKAEQMLNPNFRKQTEDCIYEMITNHYNHPSIILWGIMNECDSTTEYAKECYWEQYSQIKSLDSSRLTTSATNKYYKDLCYSMPDVVSINIYPRWYSNQEPIGVLEKIWNHIKENGGANKPLIISECGAGGIAGYRSLTRVKWTEERQSDILEELISKFGSVEDLSGIILWMFSDCRVDEEFFHERPKTQNNKGVVDIFRNTKLGYETVRNEFGKLDTYRNR